MQLSSILTHTSTALDARRRVMGTCRVM